LRRRRSHEDIRDFAQTRLDTILIVESLNASTVNAIYAYGAPSNGDVNITPGWRRIKGTVGPGTLDFVFPNGTTVNYKLQADGTLAGTYTSKGFSSSAKMSRPAA
jgi:hypothetical protein